MKKTILITGASSGFGLILAKALHKMGMSVIGTSREPEKHASGLPFRLLKLDIDSDESVRNFVQELEKNIKQLDVLVNNAGYMLTGIAEETPIEAGRQQFETNFWGTVRLTNALLPRFRAQKYGQIITVSSIVSLIGPPNLSFYTASKHAVQGYFKSLRFELEQFNVSVSMVEPTWFRTGLADHGSLAQGNKIQDYDLYRKKVTAATQKGIDDAEEPVAVIRKIIRLIDTNKPKFSNPVGKMSRMIVFLSSHAPGIFENSIHKSVKTA